MLQLEPKVNKILKLYLLYKRLHEYRLKKFLLHCFSVWKRNTLMYKELYKYIDKRNTTILLLLIKEWKYSVFVIKKEMTRVSEEVYENNLKYKQFYKMMGIVARRRRRRKEIVIE